MTKSELIDAVATSSGVAKKDVESTLTAFFSHVTTAAKKGDKVAWPGFGSFSTTKRAARKGRNPQTGEAVRIPASVAMRFAPSATLKGALNPRRAAAGAKKAAPAKKTAAKKAPAKKAAAKR